MPPDAPSASRATKEAAVCGKNVAVLNVEGAVSFVSWMQITPRSRPMRLLLTSDEKATSSGHINTDPAPLQKKKCLGR
jgi:hypothetical protein